jgi:hypothetical protein
VPTDKKGKFHLNIQRAHAADRAGETKHTPLHEPGAPKMDGADGEHESMAHTTLHDHGDGTFHTEGHDGERVDHPHIGHALMHMAAKHSDGKHMHVHHDGEQLTSHHVGEDKEVQGPHDHENLEALKDHMDQFFDEEGHEWEGGGGGYGGGHGHGKEEY